MGENLHNLKNALKDWMLVIGMVTGAGLYLLYHSIPGIHAAGPLLEKACRICQPALLFAMLFLSFCKISPKDMHLHRWYGWLLLVQGVSYISMALVIAWATHHDVPLASAIMNQRIPIEAAMICMITPTATACAVVTGKLGGDMAGVVTYTAIVNTLVALLVPAFVPLIYPSGGLSFYAAFSRILAKVFPLLILPCIAAWTVRYLMPGVHRWLLRYAGLSFYIWAVSLTLAILMSTRAIVHNEGAVSLLTGIAIASLICCCFQFWCGRRIGAHYGCSTTAGQALGQKNTVFGIWMGYTFMDPIVSVAGGFYSIWHNCFNSWQLYNHRKQHESSTI